MFRCLQFALHERLIDHHLGQGTHDAFIMDLGLPDLDGLDLIAPCRAQGSTAPVLILSARRSVDERVRGLEHGGDDYLTKPFPLRNCSQG